MSSNEVNDLSDDLSDDLETLEEFIKLQKSEKFKNKYPTEHFIIQDNTLSFIRELNNIFKDKDIPESRLKIILPKVIKCIEKSIITNDELNIKIKEEIKKILNKV